MSSIGWGENVEGGKAPSHLGEWRANGLGGASYHDFAGDGRPSRITRQFQVEFTHGVEQGEGPLLGRQQGLQFRLEQCFNKGPGIESLLGGILETPRNEKAA